MANLYRILWGEQAETQTGSRYFYNNRTRGHSHWLGCLQRTISGRAFFELQGVRQYVPAGVAMGFSHNEESSYGYPPEDSAPYTHDFLTFDGPDAAALILRAREMGGGVIPMPKGAEATRLFLDCIQRFKERGFRDRYHESALLYELLMALQRQGHSIRQDRDPVQAAHEFIVGNFASPITVADVAGVCSLSREHLSRAYTLRYGSSPGQELRRLRLKNACELLLNTHVSVEQVAERCGYRDVDAFARAFAREQGVKPLAYRQHRGGSGVTKK